MEIELNITPLRIMLDTNISPGSAPVPFKFSMIYHPELKQIKNTTDDPYLITNYLFPVKEINNMPYPKQIRFLFNKPYFTKKMKEFIEKGRLVAFADLTLTTSDISVMSKINNMHNGGYANDDALDRINAETRTTIINENTLYVLKWLFPTTYPVVNNIEQSYCKYITNECSTKVITSKASLPTTLTSMLAPLFPNLTPRFSYIKIDKIYTVVNTTWLNDMINHPKYSELIDTFSDFISWKKSQAKIKIKYIPKLWLKGATPEEPSLIEIYNMWLTPQVAPTFTVTDGAILANHIAGMQPNAGVTKLQLDKIQPKLTQILNDMRGKLGLAPVPPAAAPPAAAPPAPAPANTSPEYTGIVRLAVSSYYNNFNAVFASIIPLYFNAKIGIQSLPVVPVGIDQNNKRRTEYTDTIQWLSDLYVAILKFADNPKLREDEFISHATQLKTIYADPKRVNLAQAATDQITQIINKVNEISNYNELKTDCFGDNIVRSINE